MMENSWPLSTLRRCSTYGLERGSARNFMFFMKVKMRISRHKIKCERATKTIATQELLNTIGEHCQKLPPKITALPPKGEFGHCMMSHKV